MVPLFAKYQTDSGSCFVYDICTGEILRVGNVIYQILDDYHLLTADEICEKYSATTEPKHIYEALEELNEAQAQGLLCDHAPEVSVKVESACYQGKRESVSDFLRHRRRQLTLELTQQCNLACEYCTYGRHYEQTRQHSDMPMSLDTAKHAVACFLSHNEAKRVVIGFYGGEPLLEFELMKDIVAFAKQLAAQSGVEMEFNITTNGTLLSDEKIHFLVAHKFAVFISIDGNKETHDRYRVFKKTGHLEEREGSYDVVVKNLERFVELYPDYISRGIALTLTATANLRDVEQFVRQWKPLFPSFASSIVAPVTSRVEASRVADVSIHFGDCRTLECGNESCIRRHPHHEPICEPPDFDDWPKGGGRALERGICQLLARLGHSDITSAQQACDDAPICMDQVKSYIKHIHHRRVIGDAAEKRPATRLSCFPGAVRTFISSQGVMFPCEKVGFGKLFAIGDAVGDLDADKACDYLIEMVRLGCDCGNCVIKQVCALCPSQVTESREFPGYPDFLSLQATCGRLASMAALTAHLRTYTEIIETNPKLLDDLLPRTNGNQEDNDWLGHVKLVTAKQEPIEVGVEELAGFV